MLVSVRTFSIIKERQTSYLALFYPRVASHWIRHKSFHVCTNPIGSQTATSFIGRLPTEISMLCLCFTHATTSTNLSYNSQTTDEVNDPRECQGVLTLKHKHFLPGYWLEMAQFLFIGGEVWSMVQSTSFFTLHRICREQVPWKHVTYHGSLERDTRVIATYYVSDMSILAASVHWSPVYSFACSMWRWVGCDKVSNSHMGYTVLTAPVKYCTKIFLVQVQLRQKSMMHPKFEITSVWTNDLLIMNSTFRVPKMLLLTTEPSGAFEEMYCHIILDV